MTPGAFYIGRVLRLLVHPIPAERLVDGQWVPTLVKAWTLRGSVWYAWVDTPEGVRLAHQDEVRRREDED